MKHYVTVTGTTHYYGTAVVKEGLKLFLIKEPDNKADKEAIRVEMPGLGKIGYVANSVHTVIGDCMSAGRLYDRIGKTACARVMYILPNAIVCKVNKKDILYLPPCERETDEEE